MEQPVLDLGVFDNRFPNCLILLLFANRLRQRHCQHVFDTAGVVDAHTFDLIRRQILIDVLTIFRRQDDILHAGALGGEKLLLDAAHGQNIAAQCDLTSHRRKRTNRSIGHE